MVSESTTIRDKGHVLVAGATSTSGITVSRALTDAGYPVIAVSRHAGRLRDLQDRVAVPRVAVADLSDVTAVEELHASLRSDGVAISQVIHLVGGWRQSEQGIGGQAEDDWRLLEASMTALRVVSREFNAEIAAAAGGRLVTVSSTALARPRATNASYVALKAAAEAWLLAVADGFTGSDAAATIIAVPGLAGREEALAELVVDIARAPSVVVNGQRIILR